ncbi:PAS domain S-box protein [Geobacter pelophilus]|uniref:PAS domain S-box protein n=1 Tax=Geoanaerobacter pelophilus TaxID=60036 RepID=A0AAW4LC05_9BACT|nr:PAS domain S-box protein [Geoanaerobacter pelophilus]MBT0665931.1 PAS domain S-box protein [Geoanaerobacter pelophilus]
MTNEMQRERPLRILHLEDSPRDAELIRERLIDAGFSLQLDWAASELKFASLLQRGGYDLVLADYLLPGFEAPAALSLVNALAPGLPFIVVSGAVGEEKAVELLKLGATDYVLKDRLDKLPLAIERALDEIGEQKARRRAEEELRISEGKYRRIVDTAAEGIWSLGADHLTTFVNARMTEMLGYTGAEMFGRPMADFMFDEDVPNHLLRMGNRRHGQPEHYERRFRRKNGEAVWTLVSATPILDDQHQFQGSFAMFTDITERKLAGDELQRLKDDLERRVLERTIELQEKYAELERMNKLFVGRELKMVELKERITELEQQIRQLNERSGS